MKTQRLISNLLFASFFCMLIGFSSCCEHEEISDECIDESEICETCPCTYEYNPVCGCDGVTYGNPCAAEVSGVQTYTEGACPSGD